MPSRQQTRRIRQAGIVTGRRREARQRGRITVEVECQQRAGRAQRRQRSGRSGPCAFAPLRLLTALLDWLVQLKSSPARFLAVTATLSCSSAMHIAPLPTLLLPQRVERRRHPIRKRPQAGVLVRPLPCLRLDRLRLETEVQPVERQRRGSNQSFERGGRRSKARRRRALGAGGCGSVGAGCAQRFFNKPQRPAAGWTSLGTPHSAHLITVSNPAGGRSSEPSTANSRVCRRRPRLYFLLSDAPLQAGRQAGRAGHVQGTVRGTGRAREETPVAGSAAARPAGGTATARSHPSLALA